MIYVPVYNGYEDEEKNEGTYCALRTDFHFRHLLL